jgi:lipoprotein NlpI
LSEREIVIRRFLPVVLILVIAGCAHDERPPTALENLQSATSASERGALDQALKLFDLAIGSDQLSRENLVIAYDRRGNTYDDAGHPARAIEDYDHAIKLKPDLAPLYNDRGIAYDDEGDYDRAIADFSKAIALRPDYAEAYNNRGTAYHRKANEAQAISDFSRAIQLKPTYARAYYNRAVTRHITGDKDGAKSDYYEAHNP